MNFEELKKFISYKLQDFKKKSYQLFHKIIKKQSLINFDSKSFLGSYEIFIALRYISSNIKQSTIITLAIGIGVAIIIWIPSVNLSFFEDLIDKSVTSTPQIKIVKEIGTFSNDENVLGGNIDHTSLLLLDQTMTRKRFIKTYRPILKEILNVDGVVAAAPSITGQGLLIRGVEVRGSSVKGVIADEEAKIINIEEDIIKGRFSPLGINDIVIGSTLAEKLNVGIGDRVIISGPASTKNLKIVGIFSTGLRANDEFMVYINIKSAQQIFGLGNDITEIGVKIKDIYQANNIAETLAQKTGLTTKSWMIENKQILDQISRFKLIIAFMNFLIIFSATSSITSVFILLVSSKSKEIGILKAIGAENFSIMSIFMAQAVASSIVGYFIGLLGAEILLKWYENILSTSSGTLVSTEIPQFHISTTYAILAFVYSFVASLAASIIPSYQAAKLDPVEAING